MYITLTENFTKNDSFVIKALELKNVLPSAGP